MGKKLFKLNEDGVAEWYVATSKNQALTYATSLWGIDCTLEYFQDYMRDVPDGKISDFIDEFVKEEDMEVMFSFRHDDGRVEAKKVREWLRAVSEVPSGFAAQDY